jgi:hypothetical protein
MHSLAQLAKPAEVGKFMLYIGTNNRILFPKEPNGHPYM